MKDKLTDIGKYGRKKDASLPGGRITEEFRVDLSKWSKMLGVSKVDLLEAGFYNMVIDTSNFYYCPQCKKSTGLALIIQKSNSLTCNHCGHEFDIRSPDE
ncbi:MAG: hypothetical protein AAFY76_16305 [Cyanobacteria bacterium J06649_11]